MVVWSPGDRTSMLFTAAMVTSPWPLWDKNLPDIPSLKMKADFFEDQIIEIIERHHKKYPNLILSDDILNLVGYK